MFNCKRCIEKELRIKDLKEQISYLRLQLNPPPRINKYELEETVVMNGGGQQVVTQEDIEAENTENERIQRESDFIFNGEQELDN